MLPKATGHEARVEKRRAAAEKRRARDGSPGIYFKSIHLCVGVNCTYL